MHEHSKFLLADSQIPSIWVNVLPSLPEPLAPPLNPQTSAPLTPEDLAPIFPMELIQQEFSPQAEIDIPGEVIDIYRLWRASPLYRARQLEKALDTPAHIYYKYEGTSPAGSHKPNTAVPQAYYNKRAGIKRLATETGAGQWGSALSLACQLFGLECTVYMVRVSYDQKPYRRMMMHTWGAEVFPSPSEHTHAGRGVLAATPDSPGSLGIAISEAVEDAATHNDTNYALGSVLNHVMLHQTVIGQEAKLQMELAGGEPFVPSGSGGGAGMGAAPATGGIFSKAGLTGMLTGLKSFFGFGNVSKDSQGGLWSTAGNQSVSIDCLGGTLQALGKSDAAAMAGAGLLMDGLRRGGKLGVAEDAGGGALIGFKYGGPLGALIGGIEI